MISNKHLSVESLYVCADHVFGYDNWSHAWVWDGRGANQRQGLIILFYVISCLINCQYF